jgi:hypothetical protein
MITSFNETVQRYMEYGGEAANSWRHGKQDPANQTRDAGSLSLKVYTEQLGSAVLAKTKGEICT